MPEALLVQRLANKPAFIGGTQRVNRGYSGPIMRVHDGTTTKDVGSLAQVAAFCGANAGTVDILYDQSGNARNFPFGAARPLIWDGSAFYRAGSALSAPSIRFTAAQDFLRTTDGCGLSGTTAWTHYALARVPTSGNNQYALWGDANTLGATAGAIGFSFVYGLGGAAFGADASRWSSAVTSPPSGANDLFGTGASNSAASKALHYDVVTGPGGANPVDQGIAWRVNGVGLSLAPTSPPNGGQIPNYANTGARIGSRAAGSALFNGDMIMVGLWLVALSGADLSTLERFSERLRVQ